MKFPIINIYIHSFFFLHSCKWTTFAHILKKKKSMSLSFLFWTAPLTFPTTKSGRTFVGGERATCGSPVKLLDVAMIYTVLFLATWQLMINSRRMWAQTFFFFLVWREQHVFWHFFGFYVKPWEDFVLKLIKITATFYRKKVFISKYIFSV